MFRCCHGQEYVSCHANTNEFKRVRGRPAAKRPAGRRASGMGQLAASLLSFGLRLVMNSHHRKYGKWSINKESIDSVTKTEANEPSRFSGGDSFITHRACIAGRLKKEITQKRNLVFSPSRSDLVVKSSRVFFWNPHREIYNLGMVSGPALLKIVRKS